VARKSLTGLPRIELLRQRIEEKVNLNNCQKDAQFEKLGQTKFSACDGDTHKILTANFAPKQPLKPVEKGSHGPAFAWNDPSCLNHRSGLNK
jgi:hypothetical protein